MLSDVVNGIFEPGVNKSTWNLTFGTLVVLILFVCFQILSGLH